MRRPSIRARVLAVFLLLIVMGIVEAALVLYVQREAERALVDADRTLRLLHQNDDVGRALAAMQAAQRGFLITGAQSELDRYEEYYQRYRGVAADMPLLISDPEQHARFRRIQALIEDWRTNGSAVLIERRRRGDDVVPVLIAVATPLFAKARDELDAFERRQSVLSERASALARTRMERATAVLTVMPVLSIAVMLGLLVMTNRSVLAPLTALTAFAQRLAAGDEHAPLPPARRDEIGSLVSAFADMHNAIKRRASEAALAHQQTQLAHAELLAVINTVPAALVIMDADGSIRLQNRAAEHLLGPPPRSHEERQAYWQRFRVRDSQGKQARMRDPAPLRALRGSEVVGEELEVRRPDSSLAIILVSAAPLRDEEGRITGVAAGFQDISRLRELDRMKDEFVSVVSHELRTPLTAIRGSLQLLLADAASVPDPESRQLVEVALKSCERLVRIINDILDISKIEAGQLTLRRRPVSVRDIVQQSLDGVQQIARQAKVRIVTEIPAGLPSVMADSDRLTQALVNLLSNAVKFAPAESTVTLTAREESNLIALSVSDRGQGIASEDLSQLFQKFHQLDGSGKRRAGGTGLGLAITKAIVEEHGGHASVESSVGQGTTFTITVPAAEGLPEAPRSGPPTPLALRTFERTVLIADDDGDTRALLRRAMESAGLRVIEASTGRETVDRARRDRPDAITLDLTMPDGDGWWVIDQLSSDALTARLPVLVVTGTDADASTTHHQMIRKPFDTTDLLGNVSRLLNGRGGGTVLVADDDAEVRHVVREALERQGLTVVEAADGRQALEMAESDRFDLIVLDLDMPYVDGHDIIRALRQPERKRRVPIIVLSGSVGERHSMQSLVLGANVFMLKPPDASALAREVERLLLRP